jgi:hypothetical protein
MQPQQQSPQPSDGSFGPGVTRTDVHLGRRQLLALLRKNLLLKRRAWLQTLCELVAPLLLTSLIVIGFNLSISSTTSTPPTVFVNRTIDLETIFATTNSNSSSSPVSTNQLMWTLLNYSGPMPVPSFDTFVSTSHALHAQLLRENRLARINRFSLTDSRFHILANLGLLSFAPDTPRVRALVSIFNRTHRTFASTFDKVYPDEQSAVDFALRDFTQDEGFDSRDPYRRRSWAVLVFNTLDYERGVIDYTIRQNYSVIPSTTQKTKRFLRGYDNTFQKYMLSGYLTLQLSVEDAMVQAINDEGLFARNFSRVSSSLSPVRSAFGSLVTAAMPVQFTETNPFYGTSGPFVGLVLCMALLYPASRLIKSLVEDKESRRRETLKMMGMEQWVFVGSYAITYAAVFSAIALAQTIMMTNSVMSHSSFLVIFLFFASFAASMISLAFLIAVFFSRAKLAGGERRQDSTSQASWGGRSQDLFALLILLSFCLFLCVCASSFPPLLPTSFPFPAGIVGPIACFALILPRYCFLTSDANELLGWKWLLSALFAPTAYAFGMDVLMEYEGAQQGVTFDNMGDEPISLAGVIACMALDAVAYAAMAWYFEQVIPNEVRRDLDEEQGRGKQGEQRRRGRDSQCSSSVACVCTPPTLLLPPPPPSSSSLFSTDPSAPLSFCAAARSGSSPIRNPSLNHHSSSGMRSSMMKKRKREACPVPARAQLLQHALKVSMASLCTWSLCAPLVCRQVW